MRTARLIFLLLGAVLVATIATAQGPATPPGATGGVWDIISDTSTITQASFLLANIADAKTDWRFVLGGRAYTISPAQRLGIAGGSIFVGRVVSHYYPRAKKPIDIAMAIATAYFAGRAYANTFHHGTPIPTVPAASVGQPPVTAVAFRLRR
ncbi:MAG: hypothetical protein ACM3ZB_07130 [bacterium]